MKKCLKSEYEGLQFTKCTELLYQLVLKIDPQTLHSGSTPSFCQVNVVGFFYHFTYTCKMLK